MRRQCGTGIRRAHTLVAFVLAAWLPACTDDAAEDGEQQTPASRGQKIYSTVCVACHHPDPTKEYGTSGTFGPPIADSPYELLKMRVLETRYPEGYKPKRDTQLMTTFPLKDDQIRALYAFLQDAQRKAGEREKGADEDNGGGDGDDDK